MGTVITLRLNDELEIKLKLLTKYYSNPVVKSTNSDVLRYALEKLYDECYQEEQFRNKFNLPPDLNVVCPNCEELALHKIDEDLDEVMKVIEEGRKADIGYECQNCGDCYTYDELVNGDGRLILPASQRKEIDKTQ